MPIQSGTATSIKNFMDTLAIFAVANAGFVDAGTVVMTEGGGTVDAHSLTKGGVTWVFATAIGTEFQNGNGDFYMESRMCYALPVVSTEWSNTNPVGQPGFTRFSTFQSGATFSAPFDFYTDGVAVHAILEIFPNVYTHFSFGNITKFGTWTGGEYISCTYLLTRNGSFPTDYQYINATNVHMWDEGSSNSLNNQYLRRTIDGLLTENDFAPFGIASNSIPGGFFNDVKGTMHAGNENSVPGDGSGYQGVLFVNSPSAANFRSPLLPIYIYGRDITTTTIQYHLMGIVPVVRLINIKEIDPEAIVDNDWKVYPEAQKAGDITVAPLSEQIALAYDTTV